MKTPKEFNQNLKEKIITESMLQAALDSVSQRAKNYVSIEMGQRLIYEPYADDLLEKRKAFLQMKNALAQVLTPTCIHKRQVSNQSCDYKHFVYYEFMKQRFPGLPHNYNNKESYKYYLCYRLGNKLFHIPISTLNQYEDLPTLNYATTTPQNIECDKLISVQFVRKVITLIESGDYIYKEDIEQTDEPVIASTAPTWTELERALYTEFLEEYNLLVPKVAKPLITKKHLQGIHIIEIEKQNGEKYVKVRADNYYNTFKCPEELYDKATEYALAHIKPNMSMSNFARMMILSLGSPLHDIAVEQAKMRNITYNAVAYIRNIAGGRIMFHEPIDEEEIKGVFLKLYVEDNLGFFPETIMY